MLKKEENKEEFIHLSEEENKVKEIYELETDSKFKKSLFYLIGVIVIVVGIYRFYYTSFISNSKYAFQINSQKIERTLVDQLNGTGQFKDEKDIAYFILENQLYAKLADKEGLTVTNEEISAVSEEYPVMQKEVALKNKIILQAKEKTEKVTDEELEKMYVENKSLYADKGTVSFVGVKSNSPLPNDYEVSLDNRTTYTKTISEMVSMGINIDRLEAKKIILVEKVPRTDEEQTENMEYRYIYIYSKTEESYKSFEECKELLKNRYDEQNGYLSLIKLINAQIEGSNIIYFGK